MNDLPVYCSTFVVERHYPVSPARVFSAWSSAEAKAHWFAGPDGWTAIERRLDLRAGGAEVVEGRFPDGKISRFDARYHDVVPNRLLVYVYDMYVNGTRLSVSLVTVEFLGEREGTHLRITEQGAYYGSAADAGQRKQGTEWLMDKVGASLCR